MQKEPCGPSTSNRFPYRKRCYRQSAAFGYAVRKALSLSLVQSENVIQVVMMRAWFLEGADVQGGRRLYTNFLDSPGSKRKTGDGLN